MTKAPETSPAMNFSETVALEVQYLIRKLAKSSKDLIKEICVEISRTNTCLLIGVARHRLTYQQIRGNCSPLNISTIRLAPILLFILTIPEDFPVTLPMTQALL